VWKKVTRVGGQKVLLLFFAGATHSFEIPEDVVGCDGFIRIHKLLIEQFPINLVANTNDDTLLDEPLDLPL